MALPNAQDLGGPAVGPVADHPKRVNAVRLLRALPAAWARTGFSSDASASARRTPVTPRAPAPPVWGENTVGAAAMAAAWSCGVRRKVARAGSGAPSVAKTFSPTRNSMVPKRVATRALSWLSANWRKSSAVVVSRLLLKIERMPRVAE